MRQFYIAHLIDADGGRLASEQVWSPDPNSEYYPKDYDIAVEMAPDKVVHDACAFFSCDDNGALDLDGKTIRLYGPYTIDEATPAAIYTIAEPADDSTDIYTATRIGGTRFKVTVTLKQVFDAWPANENSDDDAIRWMMDCKEALALANASAKPRDWDAILALNAQILELGDACEFPNEDWGDEAIKERQAKREQVTALCHADG